ncbi:GntR family transcriptional regulator [Intestinibacter sp.]
MLKYQLIANQIENHIYENDLPKDTKLPTVEQLASDYGVSKSTIVKALESLVLKGIIYQVQGSGIFVRRRNRNGYINFTSPMGFTDNLKGNQITSKVLDLQLIKPNDEIYEYLECDDDEDIYQVKRVRYIDNKIMCYEESYYKKSIVAYLNQEIVQGSIFEYLKKAFNITTSFQDRYFYVCALNEELAELLMLNVNDPALVTYNQCYLPSGIIFNYSKIVYNYKNTQFYDQSSTIK